MSAFWFRPKVFGYGATPVTRKAGMSDFVEKR